MTVTTRIRHGVRYAARAARATAANPCEGLERMKEKIAERRDLATPVQYQPDPAWEQRLHQLLGVAWPCPERPRFQRLWEELATELSCAGLTVGRGAYGGWDD